MKKSKFTPQQIASILKDFDNGRSLDELIREHGISRPTFYVWRKKYGGMDAREMKRIKELEEENARLKKMYANLALDLETAKYIIEKKLKNINGNKMKMSTFDPYSDWGAYNFHFKRG